MPVTARFSRGVYERLGADIPAELVDRFNAALQAEGAAIRREFRHELKIAVMQLRTEATLRQVKVLKSLFFFLWSVTIVGAGWLIVSGSGPR